MSLKKSVGKQIKEYRLKTKISQEELAFIIGVSRNTISRAETGKTLLCDENFKKLQNFINLNQTDLITDVNRSKLINKLNIINDDKLELVDTFLDTIIAQQSKENTAQ